MEWLIAVLITAGIVIVLSVVVSRINEDDDYFDSTNMCNRCGGDMEPGKAIQQTYGGKADFDDGKVVTMSPAGQGKLIDCLKCTTCGYSLTN
jgi:hypothetical protein